MELLLAGSGPRGKALQIAAAGFFRLAAIPVDTPVEHQSAEKKCLT